jgi:2-iminobutanoate/2-iminopropanoate deaminase
MSPLQPIVSDSASGGTGGYTPALRAGDFLFVSGQGSLDSQTLAVCGNTVGEQTTHTLKNVMALVEAGGGDVSTIVRCTCYLASIDLFDEFTAAYERFFSHDPRPTRTTIGCELAGILVEIDCVAYIPKLSDG